MGFDYRTGPPSARRLLAAIVVRTSPDPDLRAITPGGAGADHLPIAAEALFGPSATDP